MSDQMEKVPVQEYVLQKSPRLDIEEEGPMLGATEWETKGDIEKTNFIENITDSLTKVWDSLNGKIKEWRGVSPLRFEDDTDFEDFDDYYHGYKKKPIYQNPWLYVGIGLLAAAGIGTYVGIKISNKRKALREAQAMEYQQPTQSRSSETTATVVLPGQLVNQNYQQTIPQLENSNINPRPIIPILQDSNTQVQQPNQHQPNSNQQLIHSITNLLSALNVLPQVQAQSNQSPGQPIQYVPVQNSNNQPQIQPVSQGVQYFGAPVNNTPNIQQGYQANHSNGLRGTGYSTATLDGRSAYK